MLRAPIFQESSPVSHSEKSYFNILEYNIIHMGSTIVSCITPAEDSGDCQPRVWTDSRSRGWPTEVYLCIYIYI